MTYHIFKKRNSTRQCANKLVSNSLRQVVFTIVLANSVLNLPDRQVKFYGEFEPIEMTFGLVHGSYILPLKQAVKLTFFAPCKKANKSNNVIT